MNVKPAFEVSKQGLEKLLARRGKQFAVLELVQNCLDEQITSVDVSLVQTSASRGYYTLTVEDDCPTGFVDLSHAYTLFAESEKKGDPTQRGRFNLGEKLVLACCRKARIVTTTGAIEWEGNQRRHLKQRREVGSVFMGELRMTRAEAVEAVAVCRRVLVPNGIELRINGETVRIRKPLSIFTHTLPTEQADAEGFLRSTRRKTDIHVHEVHGDEMPVLYELGIPVVEVEGCWHIDIQQKVPLNTDRDNVTPGYLRKVRVAVLNQMHNELPEDAARGAWVDDALESGTLDDEAVDTVLTARYGDKRVVRDPSDPESTNIAVAQGYAVIEPGSFNRRQWATIRGSGAALPSGKVTPSPKPFHQDGKPIRMLSKTEYTPGIWSFVRMAEVISSSAINVNIEVEIANDTPWGFNAVYEKRSKHAGKLVVNLGRVGHGFFNEDFGARQLRLIIHELGHHYAKNHLSTEYHDAACMVGARVVVAVSEAGSLRDLYKEKV